MKYLTIAMFISILFLVQASIQQARTIKLLESHVTLCATALITAQKTLIAQEDKIKKNGYVEDSLTEAYIDLKNKLNKGG